MRATAFPDPTAAQDDVIYSRAGRAWFRAWDSALILGRGVDAGFVGWT